MFQILVLFINGVHYQIETTLEAFRGPNHIQEGHFLSTFYIVFWIFFTNLLQTPMGMVSLQDCARLF